MGCAARHNTCHSTHAAVPRYCSRWPDWPVLGPTPPRPVTAITGYDTALPFSAQHVLALYRCLVVDIVWVKSSSKGRRLDVDGETPQPYPHVDDVFEGMVDVEFKVLLEVVDAVEGDDSGDGRALVVAPIAAEVVSSQWGRGLTRDTSPTFSRQHALVLESAMCLM